MTTSALNLRGRKTFDGAQQDADQRKEGPDAAEVLGQAPAGDGDEAHGLFQSGHDAGLAAFFGTDVHEFGIGIFFFQGFIDGDVGVDMAARAAAGEKEFVLFHLGSQAHYTAKS